METGMQTQQRPKGLNLAALAIVFFVPLPWYVCFIGCKWVFTPFLNNFAWFRLLPALFVTPLAFILPVVYFFGIRYLLVRFIDKLSKKNMLIVGGIVAALYLLSYILNEVL
jgi:hypothetical protein